MTQLSPSRRHQHAAAIPQEEARRALLKLITGNEPKSSLVELRFREPDGPMRRAFYPCRDHHTVSARAAALAQEHDVYIGCAPRVRPFGGEEAIERVWGFWVDLDGPEALERLEAFPLPPTIVVASGSPDCAHAWWALNAALRPDHARLALRRLAHALGADMRSAEPARILRLPGTVSRKYDPPAPVTCSHLELVSYSAAQLVRDLPDPDPHGPRPAPPASGINASMRGGADPLKAVPARDYVSALTGQEVGRDGKISCPFHDDATPSLHVYDVDFACFGCPPVREGARCLGGDVYVFGGLLWGLDWRDRDQFKALRRRLAGELLPLVREAAA